MKLGQGFASMTAEGQTIPGITHLERRSLSACSDQEDGRLVAERPPGGSLLSPASSVFITSFLPFSLPSLLTLLCLFSVYDARDSERKAGGKSTEPWHAVRT